MKALVRHGKEDVRCDTVPWGGQAEYLRVPYADVGPLKIESDLRDEQVLFLSDIFPTGYMAADFDSAKKTLKLGTDRAHVLREAIYCCRKGARCRFAKAPKTRTRAHWIAMTTQPRADGAKDRSAKGDVTYPMAADAPSLAWFANLASITFHVWMSRVGSIDEPDFLLFDLDPFEGCVLRTLARVALAVRGDAWGHSFTLAQKLEPALERARSRWISAQTLTKGR
jgi:hypothetical protein